MTMQKLNAYIRLVRLDKPIGILLLLWPTLWGLWFAAGGIPPLKETLIFMAGTVLMRSAGCAVNDYADRNIDGHVQRTAQRPLATGELSSQEALFAFAILALIAGSLVLMLNTWTIKLAVIAAAVAASYPFFKRFFAIPQAYLGIAFGFGIPMAFASLQNQIPSIAWWLLLANIFWAVAYDTEYAMVDKEDDLKIGIKTAAITFGRFDVLAVMVCYFLFFILMAFVGWHEGLGWSYYTALFVACGVSIYHWSLIKTRERVLCFKAFIHNAWLGAVMFSGVVLAYLF